MMEKVYGYMRVSTNHEEQKFDRQLVQLEAYGVEAVNIFKERVSGGKRQRPQLDLLLETLEEGDTVVILSIDRLSRSTKDLLDIVSVITTKGAKLKSVQDSWLDTSSENPMSDFLLTIMGALAEMERKQIVKRVNEGLAVAKAKGKEFGRPVKNKTKVEYAIKLYDSKEHTVKEISDITGVSKATLYRKMKQREDSVINYG